MVDITFVILITLSCTVFIILSVGFALDYQERKGEEACNKLVESNSELLNKIQEEVKQWDDLAIDIRESLNLTSKN